MNFPCTFSYGLPVGFKFVFKAAPVALTPPFELATHYAASLSGEKVGFGETLRLGKVITLLMLLAPVE